MNQLLSRILFATDFSEGAARAQATAFFLAGRVERVSNFCMSSNISRMRFLII